jgi:hypothetical protein
MTATPLQPSSEVAFSGEVEFHDPLPTGPGRVGVTLRHNPEPHKPAPFDRQLANALYGALLPTAALFATFAVFGDLSLEHALAIGIAVFAVPKVLFDALEKADDYDQLPKRFRTVLELASIGFSLYGALLPVVAATLGG